MIVLSKLCFNVITLGHPPYLFNYFLAKVLIKGTGRIVWSVLLVPYRSWKEIFGGKPGLGDNPLGTLSGAASVIFLGLWIYEEFY